MLLTAQRPLGCCEPVPFRADSEYIAHFYAQQKSSQHYFMLSSQASDWLQWNVRFVAEESLASTCPVWCLGHHLQASVSDSPIAFMLRLVFAPVLSVYTGTCSLVT